MDSSAGHLVFQCQSEAGPPPSQMQSAEGNAFGLKMATAVPNLSVSYNPSSIPGSATSSDQLLMLRMLAQQVSTAPAVQDAAIPAPLRMITTQQRFELPFLPQSTSGLPGARGPGGTAGLSMLPSPLPLDLSSTGVQPQIGGFSYSTQARQQQHLLRFGLQQPQPQLQYGANTQHAQYHTMQHQLLSASQQPHMQLQLGLQQQQQPQHQQQQVPEPSFVEQVAAAATAPPASTSFLQMMADQQQPQEEQQQLEQQQPSPADILTAQQEQQAHQAEASQQQPPPQQQQSDHQDQGIKQPEGDDLLQQQQQHADTLAAGDDVDAQDTVPRDAPEPLSATASGDISGQPAAAASVNPAGAAAAATKGSKYGAKRAAALKRQGYSNSVPGPNGNGKSNFRGVFWDRKNSRWRAQVGFNNRKIFMGYFGEPAEAARAYDKKVVQLHGALAKTNFPLEEYAEDLRAFNQQQQEQQIMATQQTSLMHRPRRIRRRHRFNSDTSDVSHGATDDEYPDTDMGGAAPPQPGAAPPQADAGMYPQGSSGYGGPLPGASGDVPHQMGHGSAGPYGQGAMGSFMGGYPPQMPAGVLTDPAAAATTAAGAPGVDMLQQMFAAANPAAGTDGSAAGLSADVAAAVAAAAALVGVSPEQQQDPAAAAAAEPAVGLKRKRSADGATEGTANATAADAAAVDATASGPAEVAGAKYPAAAAATQAQPAEASSGPYYSEQLPALTAADPWQHAAWMQQQQQQGSTAVPPRPFSGSRRQYSWHGRELEGGTAALPPPPLQRQYSGSHRQYSWHGDDVAGGPSTGRAMSPPAWLPTPPPHLTWQDHMKNLEASLVNAGKRDADKDSRDKDSNRDSNAGSPSRPGSAAGAAGGGGGYYRTGGGKPLGKTPQGGGGYAGHWQHLLADLAASEAGDAPGKQRRKAGWQQQAPADTDSLSALLAVAAAAEAGDSENPDAGADALAGLLSIASAAGASNPSGGPTGGSSEEGQVVLTKEQEQEWLALTSALAAALNGSAEPPSARFSEGQAVTAHLLTAIRILAQREAAAQQQSGAAAGSAEVGLPFEILSTVEQWMLEHVDQQAAGAAGQQQQGPAGYGMDSEVSIAEALACASEAGIPVEVRQMYLLVLYHVLCMKEQQLGSQLYKLGGDQAKQRQQQQHEGADVHHGVAAMEVDDAGVAAAKRQPDSGKQHIAAASERVTADSYAAESTAAQQQQQAKAATPAASSDEHVQLASLTAPTAVTHIPPASSSKAAALMAAAATAAAAAAGQSLLPEQATVAGVVDAATAAAVPAVAVSQGSVPSADAAGLLPPCGNQLQLHTAAAAPEPGWTAAGNQLAAGTYVDGTADSAAVASGGGGGSPDAGGGMSRWGSGTEGVMDVC